MLNRRVFSAGCLFLLAAAVVFTGCSQSDNTTAGAQEPPTADLGEPIIVYRRSGGLNGMEDRLCIYNRGACELDRKDDRTYRCQGMSLKLYKLEQAFADAGFFALPDEYPADAQADAIRYSIAYAANGKKHQVVAYSNALPDNLRPLVRELDQSIMLISTTMPR